MARQFQDLNHAELAEWIRVNVDIDAADPMMVDELIDLLQHKYKEEREALYDTDPSIWCEDFLDIPQKNVKWSMFGPQYDDHVWSSRRHRMEVTQDGDTIFPHVPCPDPLWEVGLAVARYDTHIVMPSATAVGKSWWLAKLVLWWLSRHPGNSKVLSFAAKQDQLKLNLWMEIEKDFPKFKETHPTAEIHRGSLRLYMDNTDDSAREKWSARGYGAKVDAGTHTAGGVKGAHSDAQMNVFEEFQSAQWPIVRSVNDGMAGRKNILIGAGNPEGPHDTMYQFVTEEPDVTWISLSGLDFINVVMEKEIIGGGRCKEDIERRLKRVKGDVEHPDFKGPMLGKFPMGGATSIIEAKFANDNYPNLRSPEGAVRYRGFDTDEFQGYVAMYREGPRVDYAKWCYVALDLAGDAIDGDYHVAIFYDRVAKEPFGMIRVRGDRSLFFEQVLIECEHFATYWPSAQIRYLPLLSFERNVQMPTRDTKIGRYPNLYRATSPDTLSRKRTKVVGWHTNKRSRPEMQRCLKEWLLWAGEVLQNSEGKKAMLYLRDLQLELSKFIGTKSRSSDGITRYAAAPGANDDTCMAFAQVLAIADERNDDPPVPIYVMPGSGAPPPRPDGPMPSGSSMGSGLPGGDQNETSPSNNAGIIGNWKPKKW